MSNDSETRYKFTVLSDFNVQNLAALLSRRSDNGIPISAEAAPFGQVMQNLLSPDMWSADLTGAVIWTSPQAVSSAYRDALQYKPIETGELLAEADHFARALMRMPAHIKYIFVPTWSEVRLFESRRGLLDMDVAMGLSAALMRMNLRLAETTAADPRIRLFDSSRWIALIGERSYDPRLWYLSKTPFSSAVFKQAAGDFAAALRGIRGGARKLLVVDLDDTLWGGVVGDVGWQNLRLGGHDATGEAYRDFQMALKALSRRGVMLAIVSKNEEPVAVEAIKLHPEMILRLDDLAGWRINWDDKARNVVALTDELNLGLDAVVFIDDNPVERMRVSEALPAVLVPEWPANPLHYVNALHRLDCFDAPFVSAEDRQRTAMYVSERERKRLHEQAPSLDDWLRTLNLSVQVEELSDANLERTVQLLNKTNQMNLQTRRLSSQELIRWAADPSNRLLVFRVTDKFGDYGLVGIASLNMARDSNTAEIVDFILSCRVMGRRVEETMVHVLSEAARASGAAKMSAHYIPTARNRPCLRFLEASDMEQSHDRVHFQWDLSRNYPLPSPIVLSWSGDVVKPREELPVSA